VQPYFPGAKVKKAMDALDKPEIKTTKFKRIEWKFINGLSEFKRREGLNNTQLLNYCWNWFQYYLLFHC